jgi:hypothetical protein
MDLLAALLKLQLVSYSQKTHCTGDQLVQPFHSFAILPVGFGTIPAME